MEKGRSQNKPLKNFLKRKKKKLLNLKRQKSHLLLGGKIPMNLLSPNTGWMK